MALEVHQFTATIPVNTPKSALYTSNITLDNKQLESIDIEVPPGPSGLMGFYIANNGVQWIPRTAGSFLVWDDRTATWPLEDQPNASGWAVVGYNLDAFYTHSVIVRFHVNLPATSPAPAAPIITFTQAPALGHPLTLS